MDESTARATAERLRGIINHGLVKAGAILGGNDLVAALKCFGALYIIGAVGRVITPMGLLYTSECWEPVSECLVPVCACHGLVAPSLVCIAAAAFVDAVICAVRPGGHRSCALLTLHFASRNTTSSVRF